MSAFSLLKNEQTFADEGWEAVELPQTFARGVAARIGRRMAVRRALCGMSKEQLGIRLGVSYTDVDAYEQGEKRMSCKALLETAKQLKTSPRFFFQ